MTHTEGKDINRHPIEQTTKSYYNEPIKVAQAISRNTFTHPRTMVVIPYKTYVTPPAVLYVISYLTKVLTRKALLPIFQFRK